MGEPSYMTIGKKVKNETFGTDWGKKGQDDEPDKKKKSTLPDSQAEREGFGF